MDELIELPYFPTTSGGGVLMTPHRIALHPDHVIAIRETEGTVIQHGSKRDDRPCNIVTTCGVEYKIAMTYNEVMAVIARAKGMERKNVQPQPE